MHKIPLKPEELYHRCDLELLCFQTTDEIKTSTQSIGQQRALNAIKFAINLNKHGYNLYVLGESGAGRHLLVRDALEHYAPATVNLQDWCYVNNFKVTHQPIGFGLPAGMGAGLKQDLEELTENISHSIPKSFEAEYYEKQIVAITHNYQVKEENAFNELDRKARSRSIAFLQTDADFSFAPIRDNEIMQPEEYETLSEDVRNEIQNNVKELQKDLQSVLQHIPKWQAETRNIIKSLNCKIARQAIEIWTQELKPKYKNYPLVLKHLAAIENDVVDNVDTFLPPNSNDGSSHAPSVDIKTFTLRYHLNLLVNNKSSHKIPIIYETNPTLENVIGKLDSVSQYGTLISDFSLIKPGALHKANGGYLILDIFKVLNQSNTWDALKRALSDKQITIESPSQGVQSTITLSPAAIPLNVKVVLLGDYSHFFALSENDPEFEQLFKVVADLEDSVFREQAAIQDYCSMIATMIKKHNLCTFSREAIARVIEESSRWVEDQEKISTHRGDLRDLLIEADYWTREQEANKVEVSHVQRAIDEQIYRVSRLQSLSEESIIRGYTLIDTHGSVVGQINGLTIANLGKFTFGQPSRISAATRLGDGKIISIEQEADLSGHIHTKGSLIMSHLFYSRYLPEKSLSFNASIVFEQSYSEIDGDSASAAEALVLISSLAEVPLKQSLAITGAIDQHGKIQAIGGVNEKIEGFFDLCKKRGLNSEQGVVIPASNKSNLMLRSDVVKAVENGQFHVYAIENLNEAIELMTGQTAGERDSEGHFPEDSVNFLVESKLNYYSNIHNEEQDKHEDE